MESVRAVNPTFKWRIEQKNSISTVPSYGPVKFIEGEAESSHSRNYNLKDPLILRSKLNRVFVTSHLTFWVTPGGFMKRHFCLSVLVSLFATLSWADFPVPYAYDCRGPIDNDEMAEFCSQSQEQLDAQLHLMGSRFVYHSFETISKELADFPELEAQYSMIFMVNSDIKKNETPTDFIPSQSLLVLKKPENQSRFFRRNSQGVITGLATGVQQLSEIIGTGHRDKIEKSTKNKSGMPYNWQGLEVVPVSTGSANHLLSFSGVFQVNWERSAQLPRRAWSNPMSNPLYLGYYYTNSKGKRERISYAAVHGTPSGNWGLLGKQRDSHGCSRVHPAVMEDLRAHVEKLSLKNVFELNWDYELPVQDVKTPYAARKPVLIIIFDGYEGSAA